MSYRKCLIDIDQSNDEIIKHFTGLHSYFKDWVREREDKLSIPTVSVIKYIVACYDFESPIVKEFYSRWTLKKKEAAKYSGILSLKSPSAAKDVESVLYCKNAVVNRVTVRYLAMLSDRDFLMYAIYNELLVNQTSQILSFDFDKPTDIAKAKENIEAVQSDISRLEQKLFGGDDLRALKNILNEESTKFMVTELRPENLVTKHERGEPVVDSPYGSDYSIGNLRFLDDQ